MVCILPSHGMSNSLISANALIITSVAAFQQFQILLYSIKSGLPFATLRRPGGRAASIASSLQQGIKAI